MPAALSATDFASVERYIDACQELAGYSLLSSDGGLSINVVNGEVKDLNVDGPPKESLAAFAVLFRQMHSASDEPASYTVVKNILGAASRSADDGLADTRLDFIKRWNGARAKLLQFTLTDIARSRCTPPGARRLNSLTSSVTIHPPSSFRYSTTASTSTGATQA